MKKKIILIITIIIAITLVITNIILLKRYINLNREDEEGENITVENNIEDNKNNTSNSSDELDKTRLKKLQNMGERGRMETYFYNFITYIEDNEYEKAYNLLYPGFKEKYFPSIDEFIEYVRKTYPEDAAYNYTDIQRHGTIYILKVEIIDIEASTEQETKTQRVVIQEKDFNDFTLSFQLV